MPKSTSEVGINPNIANFKKLIHAARALGTTYNPPNPRLKVTALDTLVGNAQLLVAETSDLQKPFVKTRGERAKLFDALDPLSTKILGTISIIDAVTPGVLADATATHRKIHGTSAPDDTATTADEGQPTNDDSYSTSQQSFVNRAAHLQSQIDLIQTLGSDYAPNETELQLSTLQTYQADLEQANTATDAAHSIYAAKKITRDHTFNDKKTGLIDTAADVKKYFRNIYGATAPEYKEISALKFVRIRR